MLIVNLPVWKNEHILEGFSLMLIVGYSNMNFSDLCNYYSF